MQECIAKEFAHIYEYVDAGNGKINYICKVCGFWFHDYEDSQP